tara:strand:- start:426 stop:584 length:159 start_codon:yes stop_codon:yes gene_type:complete
LSSSYKALGDEESQGGGNLLDDVEDAQVGVAQAAGKVQSWLMISIQLDLEVV